MSVEMIEGCLTGLTRKPHAEHHRGAASPAESQFLASIMYTSTHTQIYNTQACTCTYSLVLNHLISPFVVFFIPF